MLPLKTHANSNDLTTARVKMNLILQRMMWLVDLRILVTRSTIVYRPKTVMMALLLLLLMTGTIITSLLLFEPNQESVETFKEKSRDWRQNLSNIAEIVIHLVNNKTQLLNLLKESKIDAIGEFFHPFFLKNKSIFTDDDMTTHFSLLQDFSVLGFDCSRWPANIQGLRRALAFAVNKSRIGELTWGPRIMPLDYLVLASINQKSFENITSVDLNVPTTYLHSDPVRGNLSLLQAGFYDINGDGWREWYDDNRSSIKWEKIVNVSLFNPDVKVPNETIARESGPNPNEFPVFNLTVFNDVNNWKNVSIILAAAGHSNILKNILNELAVQFSTVGINVETAYLLYPLDYDPVVGVKFHVFFEPRIAWEGTLISSLDYLVARSSSCLGVNSSFKDVIESILQARTQEQALALAKEAELILWREQPIIPLFTRYLPSLYRRDHFNGWIAVPEKGIVNYWSFLNVTSMPAETDNGGVTGDTLNIGMTKIFSNFYNVLGLFGLLSRCSNDNECFSPLSLLFDTLWKKDPLTGEIIPWLADSWDIEIVYNDTLEPFNGDINAANDTELAQRITFHLNDQFKWHDGYPVLPEDVAFTYQFLYDHEKFLRTSFTKKGGGSIDPRRITFNNENRTITMIIDSLSYLSFLDTGVFILPKHVIKPLLNESTWENLHLLYKPPKIGSGPYRWSDRSNDSFIVLERNNQWPFGIYINTIENLNQTSTSTSASLVLTSVLKTRVDGFELNLSITSIILVILWSSSIRKKTERENHKRIIHQTHH